MATVTTEHAWWTLVVTGECRGCRGPLLICSWCNRPRTRYQYSDMVPRLSGQTSIFGVVFFLSKCLLGIEDNKPLTNWQFWPESLRAMLEYWYIKCGLFTHKAASLLRVWESRLPVGESKLTDSPVTILFAIEQGETHCVELMCPLVCRCF